MSDIPARLRAAADSSADKWSDLTLYNKGPRFDADSAKAAELERLMRAAADEIDQLRAETARLKKPTDRTMWGAGL